MGVLLWGLLVTWGPALGVWGVGGGGLVRVRLGLGAGPVRVPLLVPLGLDLVTLMRECVGGVGWRQGGRPWGCGTL